MRPSTISDDREGGQETTGPNLPTKPQLTIPSIVPRLSKYGVALLPALTKWFDILNPLTHSAAWQAFENKSVIEIIRGLPEQRPRFFLNDAGQLDDDPQLSVDFKTKPEKSHLTVVEGAETIALSPLLPNSLREYLKSSNEFIATIRELFSDVLPTPSLPTILKMRIFEYHASDPLAGLQVNKNYAMTSHTDGSVCTLIVAQSDGLLRFEHNGEWYPAVRANGKPFALVIPGVAAAKDYGIPPTPHMVLASAERRISITVFLTPSLSPDRCLSEKLITRWNLNSKNGPSEIFFAE